MAKKKILFIMCDQLRADYLGCYGHPTIKTPNIDALAQAGIRYDRAYTQSPICGPSRMSFYTGRYVRSHGSTWNSHPLRVGEMSLGDHLRPLGMKTMLCGKTHMTADFEGMTRLGVDPKQEIGKRVTECGFDVWDRLDGVHPTNSRRPSGYDDYLRTKGYEADNPWHDWANAAEGDDNALLSGWLMENADKPARIPAEHSETGYTTQRAIDFIEEHQDESWCLHLSYIKPHWPYIAPAPYHSMYSASDVVPAVRSEQEKRDPHPAFKAYQSLRFSRIFNREDVRQRVIPAYMGLISQIDDEIGRLLTKLDELNLKKDTLVVFTSDHGDYLGDHWLGEKELFHEQSVRIPLIVYDPTEKSVNGHGHVCHDLTQAIDLAPTFVEYAGGNPPDHILEGISLLNRDTAECQDSRTYVISEYDYSMRLTRTLLDRPVKDCRMTMVFDGVYKLVHFAGFRPMLFDLESDPQEFNDLGLDGDYSDHINRLERHLLDWALKHHNRTTVSDETIRQRAGGEYGQGVFLGFWDQNCIDEASSKNHGGN